MLADPNKDTNWYLNTREWQPLIAAHITFFKQNAHLKDKQKWHVQLH